MASMVKNADGTYTLTLTTREQQVADGLGAKHGVTDALALETLIQRKLNEVYKNWRERVGAALKEAYDGAAPATRQSVNTALNFTPPEL